MEGEYLKAILEFDLRGESDRMLHKRCITATEAYLSLNDIEILLRDYEKYNSDINPGDIMNLPDGPHKITSKESELLSQFAATIRRKVANLIESNNVNLGDLE